MGQVESPAIIVQLPLALLLAVTGLLVAATGAILLLLRRNSAAPLHELHHRLAALEAEGARAQRAVLEELSRNRQEGVLWARQGREEAAHSMKEFTDSVAHRVAELVDAHKSRFDSFAAELARLSSAGQSSIERIRETVDGRLRELQIDNARALDQMRKTVDEKLQGTLDKRLGESFRLVSERLEQVHKGLGEMQTLAHGVGDLKRVLTNVKVRGTWGEVQLDALLAQVLSPEQYDKNVATRDGSDERVEFCIRLPGRGEETVWLPLDAKFPHEDYQRMLEAHERADTAAYSAAAARLEMRIKAAARDIRDKYVNPPRTTDFAIMFVPTEGLYAEIVRNTTLVDALQREHRVVVAGPTTLGALLNSLQMGFRTLAIEKRSSEVWRLLGTVKGEFGKFGEILTRVQKKLEEAASVVDRAASKSRTIERKLRDVEELPSPGAPARPAEPIALDPGAGADRETG